jgi:hypothetical protein
MTNLILLKRDNASAKGMSFPGTYLRRTGEVRLEYRFKRLMVSFDHNVSAIGVVVELFKPIDNSKHFTFDVRITLLCLG